MKELNAVIIGCISIFVGCCASFFFIGSTEALNQIRQEIYVSFPLRFIAFFLFGLLWLVPLVLLNLMVNRLIAKKASIPSLIKFGAMVMAIASLAGSSIFFLNT